MFKMKPFPHQQKELDEHWDTFNRFHRHEQGLGKTKLCIDNAAMLWRAGYLDFVITIAPNGVHRNWYSDEIPRHMPDDVDSMSVCYHTQKAKTKKHQKELADLLKHPGLGWLCMSYDAVSTKAGYELIFNTLKDKAVMLIIDESHYIKTPKAAITRKMRTLSRWAKFRRVMTGTPTDGNPFDLYSQVAAYNPEFWPRHGLRTFAEFKNRYGTWKKGFNSAGREFPVLVSYRNIDELKKIVDFTGSRLTKDLLDLPEKLYTKRYVQMNPAQRAAYNDMINTCVTFINGEVCSADIALSVLTKLHQITSGFIKTDGGEIKPFDGPDHRLIAAREIVENAQHKVIIWANFVRNIDVLMHELKDFNPVRYDGSVDEEGKHRAKHLFNTSEKHRVFIANPLAGAEGLTLIEAKTSVYYSQNFRLIKRQQSEDRNHRIGQNNAVLYIDMVAEDSVDQKIVEALRRKFDIASQLTGDTLKEWI